MKELYNLSEYDDAVKTRAKQVKIFWSVFIIGILLDIGVFVLKLIFVKWGESAALYFVLNVVLTIALLIFCLIYRAIPMRITRAYVPLLFSVTHNDLKTEKGVYLKTLEDFIEKSGIKCYEMLFYDGVDSKGRVKVGRVLVEETRGKMEFNRGDLVAYKACDKILIAYEVIGNKTFDENETEQLERELTEKTAL